MVSSNDSGQEESTFTPKKAQKRLFPHGSSTKRNLFQTNKTVRRDDGISGEESDLGPMSPLDATDNSCDSLTSREYDSPCTTPEQSPRNRSLITWDRLRPTGNPKQLADTPFSSLRKLTRESRASSKKHLFSNSGKTLFGSSNFKDLENLPSTPRKQYEINEIIPETPQKDYVAETPKKENYSEQKLITPLGSSCKKIIVPRMQRRRSLCAMDSSESSSPERVDICKKRHASDSLHSSEAKIMKVDDSCSIPKARATLFPDTTTISPKLLPLSTKSFYSSNTDEKKRHSLTFGWRSSGEKSRKRQSLPVQRRSTGTTKRSKMGSINAGVKHGIKRPKLKRHVSRIEAHKKKEQSLLNSTKETIDDPMVDSKENESTDISVSVTKMDGAIIPVEDPTKTFFKTKRMIKQRQATTVNANGKIILNQKKAPLQTQNKKPKLDMSFDATDLTVDAPGFNTSINEKEVAGLLKVLEDDWADDEYDTMEPLSITQSTIRSPLKSIPSSGNVLLSPASVLSTMTSSMNIKDKICAQNVEANENKKLFPLFQKGYKSDIYEDLNEKPTRGVKRPASWQLSRKLNGDSDQYQLDAGQKRFGTIQCNECGAVYQIGEPQDENDHLIFHNSIKTLKFNGWKNERVIHDDPFSASRIISVVPSDPKHWWKKIGEVLRIVDKDLGLSDLTLPNTHDKHIYLYIREKKIIGVLVVEPVKVAHRMIPELMELNCCCEEPTDAKIGVNVIWTALSHRRQGIARKLLDLLRSNYYFGYIMTLDDIAFSIPTPSGKIFAEKYTGSQNFKVYN